MSDYSQVTNFTAKDALSSGDPEKIILGADMDGEFSAISTAIATKYDSSDRASTAEAEALTSNTVLITPSTLNDVLVENAGMLGNIQALADPNADTVLGWDDSADAVIGFTLGAGLSHAGTELNVADAMAGAGLTISSSIFAVGAGSGITVNANDVALTNVSAGAAQPVAVSSGTFTFDLSGITTLASTGLSQSQDGVLLSDNGTLKVMPIANAGVIVVNAADAAQTFALTDAQTLQVHDSTTVREWTIPANAAVAFDIGTVILLQSLNTAGITITADTGVVLTSTYNTGGTTATSDTVLAGSRASLIKVGTNEWSLEGRISD